MANILVTSPFQPFTLPTQLKAVFNGYIYCGTVDAVDPSVSQVQVYLVNEAGDKVPVAQPLRTNAGGYLVYNGQPAKFVTDSNHSLLVQDSFHSQVWYAANLANVDPDSAISEVFDILGQPDGAGLVGSANYAQIRTYSGSSTVIDCLGRTNVFDGAYGEFVIDPADTTSPDNDGTVLIDALGRRWKRQFDGDCLAIWFGVIGDGVTNCTTGMVSAIAASLASKRTLKMPDGVVMVDAGALIVGDGSTIQSSTKQAFSLVGTGFAPYTRKGTVIKARTSGAFLLRIDGLIEGTILRDIQFDCAGIVDEGIVATTVVGCDWDGFGIYDWKICGLNLKNRSAPTSSVTWSRDNSFKRFFITTVNNIDFSSGLKVSGAVDPVTPPGPHDMHHSIFEIGTIQMNKTASGCQGIYLGFTDSNQFREVDTIMVGAGIGRGITFTDQDNAGLPYPQNNLFTGCSLGGDPPLVIGTPGRNYLFHYATKDGEGLPSNTFVVRGMTDEGYFFGPHGFEMINTPLLLQGETIAKRQVVFTTPDGTLSAKIVHNATLGLEFQVFNGASYDTLLRLVPNGQVFMNISGVGFRQIQAGNADSAGSGFRTLRIAN